MLSTALTLLALLGSGTAPAEPVLEELTVVAAEPRFVAPTRRDRIGRIWAPVEINGQGPFRLVLDTGASHSAVTAGVALALGIEPQHNKATLLRGATGSATVPTIPVHSLSVGELLIEPRRLAIVPDALGGAEGALGAEGMGDKRISIFFRRDRIEIVRSRGEKADDGFITIPVQFMRGRLLVVDAELGGIRVKAVIDTGGQATLGNLALRNALMRRRSQVQATADDVLGATLDVQQGERFDIPPIRMGGIVVRSDAMTFLDLAIFEHWRLIDEPAMLVGMDVLGLLDTLIIDYRRRELQVRLHRS